MKIVFVDFSHRKLTAPIEIEDSASKREVWEKLFKSIPSESSRISKKVRLNKRPDGTYYYKLVKGSRSEKFVILTCRGSCTPDVPLIQYNPKMNLQLASIFTSIRKLYWIGGLLTGAGLVTTAAIVTVAIKNNIELITPKDGLQSWEKKILQKLDISNYKDKVFVEAFRLYDLTQNSEYTSASIRKKFYKLAMKQHPDKITDKPPPGQFCPSNECMTNITDIYNKFGTYFKKNDKLTT